MDISGLKRGDRVRYIGDLLVGLAHKPAYGEIVVVVTVALTTNVLFVKRGYDSAVIAVNPDDVEPV